MQGYTHYGHTRFFAYEYRDRHIGDVLRITTAETPRRGAGRDFSQSDAHVHVSWYQNTGPS